MLVPVDAAAAGTAPPAATPAAQEGGVAMPCGGDRTRSLNAAFAAEAAEQLFKMRALAEVCARGAGVSVVLATGMTTRSSCTAARVPMLRSLLGALAACLARSLLKRGAGAVTRHVAIHVRTDPHEAFESVCEAHDSLPHRRRSAALIRLSDMLSLQRVLDRRTRTPPNDDDDEGDDDDNDEADGGGSPFPVSWRTVQCLRHAAGDPLAIGEVVSRIVSILRKEAAVCLAWSQCLVCPPPTSWDRERVNARTLPPARLPSHPGVNIPPKTASRHHQHAYHHQQQQQHTHHARRNDSVSGVGRRDPAPADQTALQEISGTSPHHAWCGPSLERAKAAAAAVQQQHPHVF